ncbi:CBS domain-containing protein [Halobiforma nitratireducens]|uniref:Signal transduction protein with CBS domains n=1 Tax=Halobiforma nitratireducens JCM 10879 TaxID=1227454 RepID=M0LCP5_9EURY|nr:CBS domain-containing protein [Halobiforma nitratireducens]EMA30199.1 signal transduction protein with CBS domains [Halobiforma nitratireducens JCM 10879]
MERELSVKEVLTTEYVGVSESDSVQGAVELMREERAGSVLVVRGTDPVGIMTEWDVLGLVADERAPAETTVEEVMTTPVITIPSDRSLTDAANLMARENIRNVVVEDADADEVLGLVTQRDIIAAAGSFRGTVSPARSVEPGAGTGAGTGSGTEPGAAQGTGAGTEPADGDPLLEEPAGEPPIGNEDGEAPVVPNGGDEYSTQGVCEACGSLADSLWEANGQLVCSDCRTV